jgi:hypothetical protein
LEQIELLLIIIDGTRTYPGYAPHHIIEKEYYEVKERTIIVTTVNDEYLKL